MLRSVFFWSSIKWHWKECEMSIQSLTFCKREEVKRQFAIPWSKWPTKAYHTTRSIRNVVRKRAKVKCVAKGTTTIWASWGDQFFSFFLPFCHRGATFWNSFLAACSIRSFFHWFPVWRVVVVLTTPETFWKDSRRHQALNLYKKSIVWLRTAIIEVLLTDPRERACVEVRGQGGAVAGNLYWGTSWTSALSCFILRHIYGMPTKWHVTCRSKNLWKRSNEKSTESVVVFIRLQFLQWLESWMTRFYNRMKKTADSVLLL